MTREPGKVPARDKSQHKAKESEKKQRLGAALRRNLVKRKNKKSASSADAGK